VTPSSSTVLTRSDILTSTSLELPQTTLFDDIPIPIASTDPLSLLRAHLDDPIMVIPVIPFNAIRQVANAFDKTLKLVIQDIGSLESHSRLLLFGPYVLATKTQSKVKQSFLTLQRARSFCSASLDEIYATIHNDSRRRDIPLDGPERQKKSTIKAIKRLISLGRPGDAIRQLNSAGVHRTTPDIVEKLSNLHPQGISITPEPSNFRQIQFSAAQVITALDSFPKGSSAGPFGLSPGAISSMTSDTQLGPAVLESLAIFSGLFVSGRLPNDVSPFYGSARLIPLVKRKNNGIRPMAVGETLRRLACKLALTIISSDIGPYFQPTQLGVGCPNGTDTIIHGIASTMESLLDDECILQIDFKNAFNMVDRKSYMNLVNIHFPLLSNIVHYLYEAHSYLIVGPQIHLRSSSGVQQGCPLAAFLFALVLKDLISNIIPHSLKFNKWYLDDGHLAGKTVDIIAALKIIQRLGPERGILLNLSKCVVFKNPNILPIEMDADLRLVTDLGLDIVRDGIMVLGSPVGNDCYVSRHIMDQVERSSQAMMETAILDDPQCELLLLRCCTGAPRMTYWQRTCNPAIIIDHLSTFDKYVNQTLQHILGAPVREDDRLLMHLPLSLGGLGIPIASISSNAAFVASVGSSWHLQQVPSPRIGFIESVVQLSNSGITVPILSPNLSSALNDIPPLQKSKEFLQSKFMITINEYIKTGLMNNFDLRRKTIVTGRSCHGASYWLTNPPNWVDNSIIDASPFRLLVKYSLGMPIILASQRCPDCNNLMDVYGDHAVTCKTGCGVIDKHNSIVKSLVKKMRSAAMTCSYEAKNLNNSSRQRPGDIFIPEFDIYGDAYLDVSVINITVKSYLPKSSKGLLCGANVRYSEKMKKYPDLGPKFKPLVIESTGGWHGYSMDYLKTMAGHIASRSDKSILTVLNDLLSICSFALQRNQGTMLVRRCLGLF
jgi:hypothetical protein